MQVFGRPSQQVLEYKLQLGFTLNKRTTKLKLVL